MFTLVMLNITCNSKQEIAVRGSGAQSNLKGAITTT